MQTHQIWGRCFDHQKISELTRSMSLPGDVNTLCFKESYLHPNSTWYPHKTSVLAPKLVLLRKASYYENLALTPQHSSLTLREASR